MQVADIIAHQVCNSGRFPSKVCSQTVCAMKHLNVSIEQTYCQMAYEGNRLVSWLVTYVVMCCDTARCLYMSCCHIAVPPPTILFYPSNYSVSTIISSVNCWVVLVSSQNFDFLAILLLGVFRWTLCLIVRGDSESMNGLCA